MAKKPTKEGQVKMTLAPEQLQIISQAAKLKGLNLTAFCRMAAVERAQAEMERRAALPSDRAP